MNRIRLLSALTVSLLPSATSTPPALASAGACPAATVDVATADELQAALGGAEPGDVIHLADGTYLGTFVTTASGSEESPILLCGTSNAILDGDGVRGGYGLHLDGASHWRLVGFTVRNAQKGVMVDHGTFNVIEGLTVTHIGDEAIHLRAFSTDNAVRGNTISDTGLRRDKFGEGVYVGSAQSNWCTHSDCQPDESDRNVVEGNTIFDTGAESIDLKEGTTAGTVRANSFDGEGMTGGDSWLDAKGNDWQIVDNVGVNSPQDGFQMHEILDGWGTGNVFSGNTAEVNGPGFGFAATNTDGNVISCDNDVTAADEGFSDRDCVEA